MGMEGIFRRKGGGAKMHFKQLVKKQTQGIPSVLGYGNGTLPAFDK